VLEKWFLKNAQRFFRLPTLYGRPLVKAAMTVFAANMSSDTVERTVSFPALGALKSTGRLPLPMNALTVASRSLLDLPGKLFSVNRRNTAIWQESCARRLRNEVGRATAAAL